MMQRVSKARYGFRAKAVSPFAAFTVVAAPAYAQDGVSTEAATDNVIIVTAQKRSEDVREVPLSVVALSAEKLEKEEIRNVADLRRIVPSLTFNSSSGPVAEGVRIRGVGSASATDALEQGVSVVLDEIVSGGSGAGLAQLFDIEQVEVLRGPQGTLFGKNASAGVISIRTRDPGDVFEGYVNTITQPLSRGSLGKDHNRYRVELGFGGPISDKVGFRLAGFYENQSGGYAYNQFRDEAINRIDSMAVRAKLVVDTGDTRLALTGSYSEEDRDCCVRSIRSILPADDPRVAALTNIFLRPDLANNNITPSKNNRFISADETSNAKVDATSFSGVLSHEFPSGHTFRSITGWRGWNVDGAEDADTVSFDLANENASDRDIDVFTQEFQFLSPDDTNLTYVLGAFVFHSNNDIDRRVAGGSSIFGQVRDNTQISDIEVQNYAVFGHANYEIASNLSLFGGARILYESVEADMFTRDNVGNGSFVVQSNVSGAAKVSDTAWTGTVGLRYTPSETFMAYASASRGYKGPGLEVGSSSPLFSLDPLVQESAEIDPEKVSAFEAGLRWESTGEVNLQISLVGFYTRYSDYQSNSFNPQTSSYIIRNAGLVTTRGFEFDFSARPWAGASLNGGLSFVDGEFTRYLEGPCTRTQTVLDGCSVQDLSGRSLNGSPKWQGSASFRQEVPVSDRVLGYGRVSYSYRGAVTHDLSLDPFTREDAFSLVDAQLGVELGAGLEAYIFGRNLFDVTYAERIIPAVFFGGAYSQYVSPARAIGLGLNASF